MDRFTRIRIRCFRRLFDMDLELRPLTVFIGANGVGKTSILEVMSILAASARQGLNDKINMWVDLMREASERSQVIVATHSDTMIRFLDPKEVCVLDMGDDGLTEATWADTLDLESWLDEYTLDQVWQMGRMGGRS